MKTQQIHWQDNLNIKQKCWIPENRSLATASHVLLHVLAALVPAVLFPILTVWAVGSGALEYAAATFWASGFIFLALALESRGLRLKLLVGSGITTMVLAWAGSRVAPEFVVLAAALSAAWFAAPVLRRLPTLDYSRKFLADD